MRVAGHKQPIVAFNTFLDVFLSHFTQHQQLDLFKVRYKCRAARTPPHPQDGAAPALTFALNTHMWVGGSGMWATLANWGNIWGFMCCLPGTAVWSINPEEEGCRDEEQAHKQHSSVPVKLTNSDRQLTHSSENRGLSLRQEDAHPHLVPRVSFFMLISAAEVHIPLVVVLDLSCDKSLHEISIRRLK